MVNEYKEDKNIMRKKILFIFICCVSFVGAVIGCSRQKYSESSNNVTSNNREEKNAINDEEQSTEQISAETVVLGEQIIELEDGLSAVRYEGNYGFDEFLAQGGASSDQAVAEYLTSSISDGGLKVLFGGNPFGCSTLSAAGKEGGYLFGRNFDWENCNAMIVSAKPENGYASVSTVNTDFIQAGGLDTSKLPDQIQAIIGLYAPLDGMNEKGLAVSVNMIQDSDTISQDTGKTDITTTTAIRLLLDQAATVQEAIDLLSQYDLHASMGMMVHFAIADAAGNSVAVEYIGNEMSVIETPVVTNFYLTEGEKYGIGTEQSHKRYNTLLDTLQEKTTMTETDVRDALDSVSKHNFGEFESTEWSIVMNQQTKELVYFHRENYEHGYRILIEQ